MSAPNRPAAVGNYRLLQDFEARDASIRVIEMRGSNEAIDPHLHLHSTQTYLALVGTVAVNVGGREIVIGPYQTVHIPSGVRHSTHPVGGLAIVANVSVPPLRADDQMPDAPGVQPDLAPPGSGIEVED